MSMMSEDAIRCSALDQSIWGRSFGRADGAHRRPEAARARAAGHGGPWELQIGEPRAHKLHGPISRPVFGASRFETSGFAASGLGAACAVLAAMLANACSPMTSAASHGAAPAASPAVRLRIGGDVFLSSAAAARWRALPGIVSGAPGIVNLEGPVGVGDAGAIGKPLRLLHATTAIAELRAAGVAVAGLPTTTRATLVPAAPRRCSAPGCPRRDRGAMR
jgi:hypothetical protein